MILKYTGILKEKYYDASDFHITIIKSDIDYDNDGIDDYTDILNGAKEEGKKRPHYKSAYYEGGYPPEGEGVCTDIIWRALKSAGYNLKDLVDEDIKNHTELYTRITNIDSNIDFRRVYNLHVFLENNTLSLTTDINEIEEFQPGDILVFQNDKHIGIVSDKRNKRGIPYLIHHTGTLHNQMNNLEEDVLASYQIIGHYRFALKNK
jgi:uncharacterized protein YijF (DUF1287 family)